MGKCKFKVGDLVKGKQGNGYFITDERMELGEIVGFKEFILSGSCARVKILSCPTHESEVGNYYWVYLDDIELVKRKNESIVIYRNENKVIALDKSTGKKAEARCNPSDKFDFNTGAKIAFDRLMGEESDPIKEVKEVKRDAKVGEYVRIVKPTLSFGLYDCGDILKITGISPLGLARISVRGFESTLYSWEYVVLENYVSEDKVEESLNGMEELDRAMKSFGRMLEKFANSKNMDSIRNDFDRKRG